MISIIIPFYNAEPWIMRCANSLSTQHGEFEFIFVNDASTDHGADIIEEYDSRFVLIDNENKKGVSGARNTGIEHAQGEYIAFLDADDYMLPDANKIFEKAIAEDDRANIYQFNHYRYYKKIDRTKFKYINDAGVYTTDKLPRIWFGIWNKLFRTDFVRDVRFNEKLNYGEDGLFILACLAKDNYIYHAARMDATVVHCFCNDQSLSKTKDEGKLFKYIRELEFFTKKQKDPAIRQACCRILSDEWKSSKFMELIGHA